MSRISGRDGFAIAPGDLLNASRETAWVEYIPSRRDRGRPGLQQQVGELLAPWWTGLGIERLHGQSRPQYGAAGLRHPGREHHRPRTGDRDLRATNHSLRTDEPELVAGAG